MKTISEIAKINLIRQGILSCCWRHCFSTRCAGLFLLASTSETLSLWTWLCSFWLLLFPFAWTCLQSSSNFFKFGQTALCSFWLWFFWYCSTSRGSCPFLLLETLRVVVGDFLGAFFVVNGKGNVIADCSTIILAMISCKLFFSPSALTALLMAFLMAASSSSWSSLSESSQVRSSTFLCF